MLRMAVLGSGSLGNAVLIEAAGTRVLVDAGLSAKQLVVRMEKLGIEPDSLDGILLTHEHGDHTRGLDVFLRKREVPVYSNALTRETLAGKIKSPVSWRVFEAGQPFGLNGLTVKAFSVPHDAADPVGFVLEKGESAVAVASDLGFVTSTVRQHLEKLDGLFIESNYDQQMLDADLKRPFATKQRISSRHGHLSNEQVGDLLSEVASERLRQVVVGHLSKDCNCPDLVTKYLGERLSGVGQGHVEVSCAGQDEVTGWFTVLDRVPVWEETKGGMQGELF